jgi:hypothetical protein
LNEARRVDFAAGPAWTRLPLAQARSSLEMVRRTISFFAANRSSPIHVMA